MAQPTLTLATGLLAGMHSLIPIVAVPAILASTDPLPVWQTTYINGRNTGLTAIAVTTAAGLKGFLESGSARDYRFLIASGLSSAIAVYTLIFMKPVNDALFAVPLEGRQEEDEKVRQLIGKWNKLQIGRVALGLGAFATAILITYKR